MNPKRLLLSLFLVTTICTTIFGQATVPERKDPVRLWELIEFLTVKRILNDHVTFDPSGSAIEFLNRNCNVGFIDDGTNYWALRTLGASEELMKQVDRCTSAANRDRIIADRRTLSEEQIQVSERLLIGDLFRKMFSHKDIDGRKRTIMIGKEYIRRYEKDGRFTDPGTDELLQYLKVQVPKMELMVSNMESTT